MLTDTYLQGKSFFLPWQSVSIPYDSLLGLSITLNRNSAVPVYLTHYHKHDGVLDLILQAEGDIIASLNESLEGGIQYIHIPPNDKVVGGTITVIDTPSDELFTGSLQLSPLYIHYNSVSTNTDTMDVNGTNVSLVDANFNFDAITADVRFEASSLSDELSTAYIKFNDSATPVITQESTNYIRSFAGQSIDHTYKGILKLPQGFTVSYSNDSFALITPYNYETCATSKYLGDTLGAIDCSVSRSDDYPLPLDICFDGEGTSDSPWKLNPMRIDSESVPDADVLYTQLDPVHQ